MKQERIESIHARYDFSPGELNEIANEMALVVQQIEDLEEEKKQTAKELAEKIKTVSEHLQYLARCRRNGHDFRTMECIVQYDLVTGMKEFYWTGDNRLVDTREMNAQEIRDARQQRLNFE